MPPAFQPNVGATWKALAEACGCAFPSLPFPVSSSTAPVTRSAPAAPPKLQAMAESRCPFERSLHAALDGAEAVAAGRAARVAGAVVLGVARVAGVLRGVQAADHPGHDPEAERAPADDVPGRRPVAGADRGAGGQEPRLEERVLPAGDVEGLPHRIGAGDAHLHGVMAERQHHLRVAAVDARAPVSVDVDRALRGLGDVHADGAGGGGPGHLVVERGGDGPQRLVVRVAQVVAVGRLLLTVRPPLHVIVQGDGELAGAGAGEPPPDEAVGVQLGGDLVEAARVGARAAERLLERCRASSASRPSAPGPAVSRTCERMATASASACSSASYESGVST